jgi:hypothetical protein
MSIETIPGTDQKYYLISFDADGNERADETISGATMSQHVIKALRDEAITDVFFLSHGWKGDIPAAKDQYNRWIGAMIGNQADRERMLAARPNFKPLFVGLHWPSQPWGDEEFDDSGVSFSTSAEEITEQIVNQYAEKLADTPAAREALRTIVNAALEDIAPAQMPEEVKQAYLVLDREAGMANDGETAAPGDDRAGFDPEEAYQVAREEEAINFGGGFELGGLLSPLRQLSFWKMKKRACRFGENGATKLLAEMQNAADPEVRFHLMGHSFGCIAVSAMLAGPNGRGPLVRPVDSVALVQGAFSIWGYCSDIPHAQGTPGYFRSIVADRRVRGPIIVMQSVHDTAVGRIYPIAAGIGRQVAMDAGQDFPKYAGIGAFGLRGPEVDAVDQELLPVDGTYRFEPGKIYNLESSGFINEGEGASGAHSDIAKPAVWHAIWEAARQSR